MIMQQINSIAALREQLATVRKAEKKIALVPTMGNLHAGHLSLVKLAQQCADYVVVSIFVNPSQFVAGEDFEHYPRTLDSDLEMLDELNVDLVFIPQIKEIYPDNDQMKTEVTVPELDSIYCGEYRPGHFKGVATVVTKLLNMVQPDIAVFGEKDFQQLLVIKRLVKDLNIPVAIIGAPIEREKDGLAMSSRNQYLTESERQQAPKLFVCLSNMAVALKNGNTDYKTLENQAIKELKSNGFKPEYVSICDAESLKSPNNQNLVIIAAAWLGKAGLESFSSPSHLAQRGRFAMVWSSMLL